MSRIQCCMAGWHKSTVCFGWRSRLVYETTNLMSNRVPTDLMITGGGTPGVDHCDVRPDRYLSH
jgi:hypothetical protein